MRASCAGRSRASAAASTSTDVAVLQAGSWGTTLATILARDGGKRVVLWTRDARVADEIARRRENQRYLPGVRIPDAVTVTGDIGAALEAPDVVIATPSAGVPGLRDLVAPLLGPHHRVCSATKGLADDGRRMSELWSEVVPGERVAVLSGPNISREIAAGLPAPTVVASASEQCARQFQRVVGTPMFRAYTNDDVVGVELCGALKNVIALGAGAIDGMGYGENAKAGFLTRGLAEIARLAYALGANPLTAAGLAGFGDLVATCASAHSRNRTVGELLSKGVPLADIHERLGGQVAEGVATTHAASLLARRCGVEMPIVEQTRAVLFEGRPVRDAMRALMERDRGDELAGPLADAVRALLAATRPERHT